MKFLLGNNTFDMLAGSEIWMLTLATELKKQGHEVSAYSPNLGFIAAKLGAIGVNCMKEISGGKDSIKPFNFVLEEEEKHDYDAIICSHNNITKYLKNKLPNVPIIGVVHGIMHKNPQTGEIFPEHPVTEFEVDQYIAVSEEVQDLLLRVYGIQAKLVRNFFDLDKFSFKKKTKISDKPKTILVNSNYWGVDDDINKIIKEVADYYDAKFIGVGANFAPTFEVEQVMEDVDVVFGMGRSVLEGVCMGKIGVVHGRWGTGGVITPETYENLKLTNFSGRRWEEENTLKPSQEIISEIDNAWSVKTINSTRKIMEENHNVKTATKEIVNIAKSLKK